MPRESKAELTDRLRREGRWEAFKSRRAELKAEGIPAKYAWYQAACEFPPEQAQASNGRPKVDVSVLKGKPAVPVVESAKWVVEVLDCDWITPGDAPSAGAWGLVQWARSSMAARAEFYRTFVARIAIPSRPEASLVLAKKEREEERRRRKNAEFQAMIDSLLKQSKVANGQSG